LYSAAGCDFVRIDIGFTPSNNAWNNATTAELGLFFYQSGDVDTNRYRAALWNGCRQYSDEFTETFIAGDRTWTTSRVMAYVAAGGGMVATVTAWLFVLTPLPVCFLWPGIMLPALLAAFLSEGSKFLFFDTAICRNNVWYPPGEDSLPQSASCSLGMTSFYSIGATVVLFFCLAIVCLRAPERRKLQRHYGMDLGHEVNEETSDDYNDTGSEQDHFDTLAPAHSCDIEAHPSEFTITSRGDISDLGANSISLSGSTKDEDDLSSHRTNSRDGKRRKFDRNFDGIEEEDDRFNPQKPLPTTTDYTQTETADEPIVSESRLSTVEKLASNTTALHPKQDLIDNFIREFNASFDERNSQSSKDETNGAKFPVTI
jgi:hypothetical protein